MQYLLDRKVKFMAVFDHNPGELPDNPEYIMARHNLVKINGQWIFLTNVYRDNLDWIKKHKPVCSYVVPNAAVRLNPMHDGHPSRWDYRLFKDSREQNVGFDPEIEVQKETLKVFDFKLT